VVLASNLTLENFVEPRVMGRSLDVRPLVVLIVTALGCIIGGIVGLILAVPFFVIARMRHRPPSVGPSTKCRPCRTDLATHPRLRVSHLIMQTAKTASECWAIAELRRRTT
jgi:AI-2E family transporter